MEVDLKHYIRTGSKW